MCLTRGSGFTPTHFPLHWQGRDFVFVEELDHRRDKGIISCLEFSDHGPTGPARPVLEQPWHLSYPFLIEDGGEIFMVPESSANKTVDLYRAVRFPDRWTKEATLLDGIEASDATIIRNDDTYFMFASTRNGAGSYSDTLSIFRSPKLQGPWKPHPCNPVLIDQSGARPAGNMIMCDGRIWRPVQGL